MKKRTGTLLVLNFIACGLAGTASSVSQAAPPFLINMSGATLLRNLIVADALTNDFCDVDGDLLASPFPDQLAPAGTGLGVPNQRWQVQYRGTGSVAGFTELQMWGQMYALNPADIAFAQAAEGAFHNRDQYVVIPAGMPPALDPPANAANPGAAPTRSTIDGTFMVTNSTSSANAGILIDISPLDIPTPWATRSADGTGPGDKDRPGDPGYGHCPIIGINKDGTPTVPPQDNRLPPIAPLNINYTTPDASTVYDTAIAIAPIAATVNFGVGYQTITYTDLKWLSVTGRTSCGENLMFVCRDIGSGTRNAFQNSICVDPSWGNGDNIGRRTTSGTNDLLGPNFQPGHKGSNSRIEGTMQNHRLAVGYVGAERGVEQGWLTGGRFEVLGVIDDTRGGTMPARPHINNVLDNSVDGFNISGPAVFATIGDPRATASCCSVANGNPAMQNVEAAHLINNVTCSIAAFKSLPGGDPTLFSPGEFLAVQFIPVTATDFAKDLLDPCNLITNTLLNSELQEFVRDQNILKNPAYLTFNTTANGLVPTRTGSLNFTDGNAGANRYIGADGVTQFNYGSPLNLRNKISGDFNNDGVRDCEDALELIRGWRGRHQASPWNTPASVGASQEIIGDFNGDGNFNDKDVRYWADGLALDPMTGKLNRCEGFRKVDQAYFDLTGNRDFFGDAAGVPTVLATGDPYKIGDAVGDVAGPAGLWTKGYAPIGQDGRIDAFDIDYVCKNFGDWSDQSDARVIDLTADINGDLIVDIRDKCKIVVDILGTKFGDVDLDGSVDSFDAMILTGNPNFPGFMGGWAQGDVNGDMIVDNADLLIIQRGGVNFCCPWDLNGDGAVGAADLAFVLGAWGGGNPNSPADFNGDGVVGAADLAAVLGAWGPCP